MKKSLIALAVLAASGAAMAQSSVTVYGRVDLSVGSLKELDKGSQTKAAQAERRAWVRKAFNEGAVDG